MAKPDPHQAYIEGYQNAGSKMEAPSANATEAPTLHGSLWEGFRRGWHGLKTGTKTGALIGVGTAGALLGIDTFTPLGLLHGAPLEFLATTTGIHSIGAAGFEGITEFNEGRKGLAHNGDPYEKTANKIDERIHALEHQLATGISYHPEQNMAHISQPHAPQQETPQQAQHETPRHIQNILDRGSNVPTNANWQERVTSQPGYSHEHSV